MARNTALVQGTYENWSLLGSLEGLILNWKVPISLEKQERIQGKMALEAEVEGKTASKVESEAELGKQRLLSATEELTASDTVFSLFTFPVDSVNFKTLLLKEATSNSWSHLEASKPQSK